MTNKLGSANPNKIPRSKTFEFNAKGIKLTVVENYCNKKLNQYSSDIKRLFHLESKINSFEERVANLDEEVMQKELGVSKDELSLELKRLKKEFYLMFVKYESAIMVDVHLSNSEIDCYGIPKSIGYERDIKAYTIEDEAFMRMLEMQCVEGVRADAKDRGVSTKIFDAHIKNGNLRKEIVRVLPTMIDVICKHYGKQYQLMIRKISKVSTDAIKRLKSKKKDNTYIDEDKYSKLLMPYWNKRVNDAELPDNHTRESLFTEIAKEMEVSFDRVCQVERQLREKYKPKEIGWDENYTYQ